MAVMKSKEEMRQIAEAKKKKLIKQMDAATAALKAFAETGTPTEEETREWLLGLLLDGASAELRLRIIGRLTTTPCDHRGDPRRR